MTNGVQTQLTATGRQFISTVEQTVAQFGGTVEQTAAQLRAAVEQNMLVLQQQTQRPAAVTGTEQGDIIFASANESTLAGGAGDDILVAGATRIHVADLQALNASGASGTAILVQDGDTLTVRIEIGRAHV